MESRAVTVADEIDIIDTKEGGLDAFAAYYAEVDKSCDREVTCILLQSVQALGYACNLYCNRLNTQRG